VSGSPSYICPTGFTSQCTTSSKTINLLLSFVIYGAALLVILGYIPFIFCGGCGMAACPVSLMKIFFFRNRKRVSFQEFKAAQKETLKKTIKLLEYGKIINDRSKKFMTIKDRNLMRIYVNIVNDETEVYRKLKKSYEKAGDGFIIPFCCFCFGILCGCVTVIWWLHMLVNMVLPAGYNLLGLSFFLIYLNAFLPPAAWIMYLFFVYFLITSIVYGNIKVFSRIPFINAVFPLVWKETMLNAFMINASIFLIGTITVLQFSCTAFKDYMAGSAIYGFFTFFNYMFIIGYFFQYIHYFVFAAIPLGLLVAIVDVILDCFGFFKKKIKMLLML